MWFFNSPEIVFGEDALSYLGQVEGKRAFLVTDQKLIKLGYAGQVQQILEAAGFSVACFDNVEADPSTETALAGAQLM